MLITKTVSCSLKNPRIIYFGHEGQKHMQKRPGKVIEKNKLKCTWRTKTHAKNIQITLDLVN